MTKPKCKMPDVPVASHLIGLTISSLKKAGKDEEMRKFIDEVIGKNSNFSQEEVLDIAGKYVEFYNKEY